jgi:hypothetical protein
MSILWLELWDYDDLVKNKSKQIIKPNFQLTQYWKMKLKKSIKKLSKKVTLVNLSKSWLEP